MTGSRPPRCPRAAAPRNPARWLQGPAEEQTKPSAAANTAAAAGRRAGRPRTHSHVVEHGERHVRKRFLQAFAPWARALWLAVCMERNGGARNCSSQTAGLRCCSALTCVQLDVRGVVQVCSGATLPQRRARRGRSAVIGKGRRTLVSAARLSTAPVLCQVQAARCAAGSLHQGPRKPV